MLLDTHLVAAELEKDVNVVSILEKAVEANHILVVEGAVDLNLSLELQG